MVNAAASVCHPEPRKLSGRRTSQLQTTRPLEKDAVRYSCEVPRRATPARDDNLGARTGTLKNWLSRKVKRQGNSLA